MIFGFYSPTNPATAERLLSTVAERLVENGAKVLVVDANLQTPNIEGLFKERPSVASPSFFSMTSLIEMEMSRATDDVDVFDDDAVLEAEEKFLSDTRNCEQVYASIPLPNFEKPVGQGEICLVPSGYEDFEALLDFDWKRFMGRHGANLVDEMQDKWKDIPYVLINCSVSPDLTGMLVGDMADAYFLLQDPTPRGQEGVAHVQSLLINPPMDYETMPSRSRHFLPVVLPTQEGVFCMADRVIKHVAECARYSVRDPARRPVVDADLLKTLRL